MEIEFWMQYGKSTTQKSYAHDVMLIIEWNTYSEPSLNPGWDALHFP